MLLNIGQETIKLFLGAILIAQLGVGFLSSSVHAELHVPICQSLGRYCNVSKMAMTKEIFVFKNRIPPTEISKTLEFIHYMKVWSSDESNAFKDQIVARLEKIEKSTPVETAAMSASAPSPEEIAKAEEEARNALKKQIQELIRAQTCENIVLPKEGETNRAPKVLEKYECLVKALNNWRGVDVDGKEVQATVDAALTRAQVRQILRSLVILSADTDLENEKRPIILNLQRQCAMFNL